MQIVRPANAVDPRAFGRAIQRDLPTQAEPSRWAADIKLFATTFVAGFIFVSVFLA